MATIYEQNGLRRVVNASGRMTILGVSTISDETAAAMKQAAQNYVVIEELVNRSGEMINRFTGAEASCVTSSTAAAICLSCAAAMTGNSMAKAAKLPDTTGLKNEVIIQKGQSVNFGAPVRTCVMMSGAKVVEVGDANLVHDYDVEGNINEHTAALLYVKSHHCVQKGMLSIEKMVEIAHSHNLPLIIDASAEEDLKKYVALGADLVCYSGAKAFEGPTSGFVTGKKEYIDAVKLQYKGIGRLMKAGKETMMGLASAIEQYVNRDNEKYIAKLNATVEELVEKLQGINGTKVTVSKDEAGRAISRCRVTVQPESKINAYEVIKQLEGGSPAIYTRNYYANLGEIEFDPRPLLEGDIELIVNRVKEVMSVNN